MSNLQQIIDKAQATKCLRCNNNYNYIVFGDICNQVNMTHTMYDINNAKFIDGASYYQKNEDVSYLDYDLRYWYNYNFVDNNIIHSPGNYDAKLKLTEIESSDYDFVHTCFNKGFDKYSSYYVYEISIHLHQNDLFYRFIHDVGLEKDYTNIKYPYSSTSLSYFSILPGEKYITCSVLNPSIQTFNLEPNTINDYFASLDINRSIKIMEDIDLLG